MQSYWDNVFKKQINKEILQDDFLERYYMYFKNLNGIFVDLGCGTGHISKTLKEKGKNVIAVDNSEVALSIVKEKIKVKTLYCDIKNKLPFDNNTVICMIADLSLHYFSEEDTFNILNEINRVLKDDGILIFRVNSILDINYGANSNYEIEKHYFNVDNNKKRFFDIKDINYFFKMFNIVEVKENKMYRYDQEKIVIEGIVKK